MSVATLQQRARRGGAPHGSQGEGLAGKRQRASQQVHGNLPDISIVLVPATRHAKQSIQRLEAPWTLGCGRSATVARLSSAACDCKQLRIAHALYEFLVLNRDSVEGSSMLPRTLGGHERWTLKVEHFTRCVIHIFACDFVRTVLRCRCRQGARGFLATLESHVRILCCPLG